MNHQLLFKKVLKHKDRQYTKLEFIKQSYNILFGCIDTST
jgi:hypothetical protein